MLQFNYLIMTDISILKEKSKFLLLNNFMKCFSGTINQIVIINIWMVNCLIFSICYFQPAKKENMIIDNIFRIITLEDNLVLIWKFWNHNIVFCSFYTIYEICVLLFVKT